MEFTLERLMGLTEKLEDALSRLRPIEKEIILLRHFDELTNEQAADALLVPPAAASKLYVRAMRRLKARAAEESAGSFQPFAAPSSSVSLMESWREEPTN